MSDSPFDPKHFVSNLTTRPGVYRMYEKDVLLYVGKAKNLKNRVSSYFRNRGLNTKTVALVNRIESIEVTVTQSETEALLLEQTLIKQHRPPYNILLRDDKSYPYILLSNHQHPALLFRRGNKVMDGQLFGPFPNATTVRDSLSTMQKVFKVRQCEDSYYSNRSRPCLQYQIKRCSAPCVAGLIDDEDYKVDVKHARMFLEGKDQELVSDISETMKAAAAAMEFERAAELRDQITQLKHVQEQQYVHGQSGEADILAALIQPGGHCVHSMLVRNGKVVGSKSHYPKMPLEMTEAELLTHYIAQSYIGGAQELPKSLILSHDLQDDGLLEDAIFTSLKKRVEITAKVRGQRARWLDLAKLNAEQGLQARLLDKKHHFRRVSALQKLLGLPEPPEHMECFDISHSSGEATVASCVVFGIDGPDKKRYRSFNINDVDAGDDYGAMKQALTRRYKRVKAGELPPPDVLLIDGGKGQLTQAENVLKELGLVDIFLLGVAKGDTRKPGLETLYVGSKEDEVVLPPDSPALHLIQHIRDEAHRFAIKTHRNKRDKKRQTSSLEAIPGIGATRRKNLLVAFGGYQELCAASEEEIAKVKGISVSMAKEIYTFLH